MLWYLALLRRCAHKLAYIATVACLRPVVLLCRGVFESFPDGLTLAGYGASLILGFVIGFISRRASVLVGFWLLEVTSLMYIINIATFFVSGQLFPLDLPGPTLVNVLHYLPSSTLAYFPAMIFLEMNKGRDLAWGLAIELAWAIFFVVLARWLFRLGLRHLQCLWRMMWASC